MGMEVMRWRIFRFHGVEFSVFGGLGLRPQHCVEDVSPKNSMV